MTRLKTLLLCLCLTLLPAGTLAQSEDTAASLERMVQQVEAQFPILEGYVLSVDTDQVLIDLKQGQDIAPGDSLKVVRLGKEIIHPVTKKKIGRKETDLGRITVKEVRRDYSVATVDESSQPLQKGDGVRSFFRKLTLLVAPVQSSSKLKTDPKAVRLEIEDAFNSNPRFQVPPFDLKLWMVENKVHPNQLAQSGNLLKLQKQVDADYILMPDLSGKGKKTVLGYRLISAVDGTVITQSRVLSADLPKKSKRSANRPARRAKRGSGKDSGGEFRGFNEADSGLMEFVTKQEFPYEIVDMDSGDIDGDGEEELIVIDSYRVILFESVKGKFRQRVLSRGKKGLDRFLSVDVADINENKRAEIFVTNSVGLNLQSFVIEQSGKGRRMRKVEDDINLYFRVLKPFNEKPRLIAQKPGYDRPFRQDILEMAWKGDEYDDVKELELAHITGQNYILYGFLQGDVTLNKKRETIILDTDAYLRVYSSSGRLLIKSDDYFGHDPRVIDVAIRDQIPGLHNSDNDAQAVRFRGRLQLLKNKGDRYLILPRNHRLGGSVLGELTVVNNSNIVLLGIDRQGLNRVYETRKQKGYLAAFRIMDTKDPQKKAVHVAHVSGEGSLGMGKKISTVFTYHW